jgi:hypothetical protein
LDSCIFRFLPSFTDDLSISFMIGSKKRAPNSNGVKPMAAACPPFPFAKGF